MNYSRSFALLIACFIVIVSYAQQFTRGIGIYPGNENENFSPEITVDDINYRNLALNKPAFHSSCYNYNQTAQLINDGIKDSILPEWISTSSSQHGILKKNEKQWVVDRHFMTAAIIDSSEGWVQFGMYGSHKIPVVDSMSLSGMMIVDGKDCKGWRFTISGSETGDSWEEITYIEGDGSPGDSLPFPWRHFAPPNFRLFNYPVSIQNKVSYKLYRVDFKALNIETCHVGEMAMFFNNERIEIGGAYNFISAWMSEGNELEWVYIDLGEVCSFDRIALSWIRRAAAGYIQVSDDALSWKNIKILPENIELKDDIVFEEPVNGRYVRLLLNKAACEEGYILSEMEIFGKGGLIANPLPPVKIDKNGRLDLAGGNWKIQRESLVNADGITLSETGYPDDNWLVATVPATVLVSYLNAGALPDPNYADNQVMISESFFYSDFWYRNEFVAPESYKNKRVYLNFDGINWKAEVYLNGKRLGMIEGAFTRADFDVTDIIIPGKENAIAVKIIKNAAPGFVKEQTALSPDRNGGELGADNPTFHASVGWDWIPTIRGRNTGIWNDVYFTESGPVTIKNPFVSTDMPLPDITKTDINIEIELENHTSKGVKGIVKGKFGEIRFDYPVTLKGYETKIIKLDPSTNPQLQLNNPKLWWPNGYGSPYLYDVELSLSIDEKISDSKSFKTGVRELTFSEEGGILKIWINGRRFIGRGGNWGFSESMLRYRAREYNIAVCYHKDMNFTMIRNWVGQTGDDEFYEACDRYGIMVWQDFWLANPVDGPNPDDPEMFMQNAKDMILRIRNHPSIGVYCGRNEGYPPEVLDTALRKLQPEIHPGLHYISHSSWDFVSGGGPYRAMPIEYYFKERATPKFHTEMGMPNIVSYESLKEMMPESALWPIGRMWGLHDFCMDGAQRAASFIEKVEESYGNVDNAKDWVALAQWINYQGYRAMFEAQSKYRMGLFLWMSHPAWPSLVWQTYDYCFEPTAAYFACKKASEPLHIQWNPVTDSIEVVNYSIQNGDDLKAIMQIINMDGKLQIEKEIDINCVEDNRVSCFAVEYPEILSSVYFIRLKLMRGDELLSENFYWRGLEENNFKAIREIPKIKIEQNTKIEHKDSKWYIETLLNNPSDHPALMVKLKVIREKTMDRILPLLITDNYISLMPGEQKTVFIEFDHADSRGEDPIVIIEGFNILN